jgi:hypothetical protein
VHASESKVSSFPVISTLAASSLVNRCCTRCRLDLLEFFKQECEERGATIIYATHVSADPARLGSILLSAWQLQNSRNSYCALVVRSSMLAAPQQGGCQQMYIDFCRYSMAWRPGSPTWRTLRAATYSKVHRHEFCMLVLMLVGQSAVAVWQGLLPGL